MFWSEIPIWGGGFPTEVLGDPDVVERGLQMHKEMVKEYYNHPSIVFWGLHNEIWTAKQEAYNMSKIYYEYLKANGGNRIVTYASCNPNDDICLEFCKVVTVPFIWHFLICVQNDSKKDWISVQSLGPLKQNFKELWRMFHIEVRIRSNH